jgi:hypothetical protein
MSKFERLLIPIVVLVMLGAFLLEDLSATSVRRVALVFGSLLVVALVFGMYHRWRKKVGTDPPASEADQTSNEPRGPVVPG